MLTTIRDAYRRQQQRRKRYPTVFNANQVDEQTCSRRALLVYLPRAFLLPEDDVAFLSHQNMRRCRLMVDVLGERGFVVDVVNKRDLRFRPRHRYDLMISERLDWGRTLRLFDPHVVRVFLATASDHVFHNESLRRRHARLLERGRQPVKLRRIYQEKMPAVASADALVGVGNDFTMGTWKRAMAGPIFPFNSFALRAGVLEEEAKDFEAGRRHFLFFASGSQMQKGLDLLLEIFPRHPHLHLYVCSRFDKEPDFCAAYRRELYGTPNVHAIGWISVASATFLDLMRTCAFVVLPSCAEGQSGAVVHCMHSGLIPLVTRAAGLDTSDFGITFADDSIEEIERVVVDLSRRPPERLRARSAATRRIASDTYSESAFIKRWGSIVTDITGQPR